MRITDALLGEHSVIYQLLDHVDRSVATWNLDQAREASASLAAVLRPHNAMERLFETLEQALGHEPVPLAVLRLEHEEIEAILNRLVAAQSMTELRPQLNRLVKLAADHFAKEEGILLPLAHHHLDEETLNRLGVHWAESRRPKATK